MSTTPTPEYLSGLLAELRKLPTETGWAEFKENNSNPEEIGEYLSALSNTAALVGKAYAYLVWGIKDDTHEGLRTGPVAVSEQRIHPDRFLLSKAQRPSPDRKGSLARF